MRTTVALAFAFALALPMLAPPASAGIDWFPVCHDKDVRAGGVWVHVGVDCERGVWVEECLANGCRRHSLAEILS